MQILLVSLWRAQAGVTGAAGATGGIRAAYKGLLAEAGPIGFMRGAGMRVVWISPQGCVYYPVYEAVQRLLTPSPK